MAHSAFDPAFDSQPKSGPDGARRRLLRGVGAAVGAAILAPRLAQAQSAAAGPVAPPSTITQPPRDFSPQRRADHLLHRPRRADGRPGVRRPAPAERADPAAVDRRAVGRRAGLELGRPLPRLERHSEQPPAALDRRRRPRQRVPHAVEQQQRQHVRLPGPAALVRAPDAARGALRARRLGHACSPSMFNGKRLNSPNDVVPHPDGSYWFTDPPYGAQLYEGTVDAAGGPANKAGRLNPQLGQPPEIGAYKRELPTAVYRLDKSGTLDAGCRRRPGAGPERPVLLARFQEALRRQHRPGAGRHRSPAARATCTCSMSAPTTSSATASSSATS